MKSLALLFLLAAAAGAEPITPIDRILRDTDASDGRNFCVLGLPTQVAEKYTSSTKRHRFRTVLDDGTGKLMVFAFGYFPDVAEDERIEVCGLFYKRRLKHNGRAYHNELDARAILRGKAMAAGGVSIGKDVVVDARKPTAP